MLDRFLVHEGLCIAIVICSTLLIAIILFFIFVLLNKVLED